MKTIILHIGHDKTATTSIQSTFKSNHIVLEKHGYFYPLDENRIQHNRIFKVIFAEDISKDKRSMIIFNLLDKDIDNERLIAKEWLLNVLTRSDKNTIVFSAEVFIHFKEEELERIRVFFEGALGEVKFKVFFYTRDPVSYTRSSYQQNVRLLLRDEKYQCIPYEEIVTKFQRVFGERSFYIYKFEDACQTSKGPVHFLLKKMGVKDEVLDQVDIQKQNESMSNTAVDILTYINKTIPITEKSIKGGLRKKADSRSLRTLQGQKFQLKQEEIKEVIDLTKKDIEFLYHKFNIKYETSEIHIEPTNIVFSLEYKNAFISAFDNLNIVIKKLAYCYIQRKLLDSTLNVEDKNLIAEIKKYIQVNYPLIDLLSLKQICLLRSVFCALKISLQKDWIKYIYKKFNR